jgi:hypothetical protein
MLPAALAVATFGFIGAFGTGSVPSAYAVEGDICNAMTDATVAADAGQFDEPVDYVVAPNVTHGLVFRVEDSVGENVAIRVDSETGSARITSQAEFANANDLLDDNDDTPSYGNFYDPDVAHILVQPATGSIVVDTIEPFDFNDADGNPLDSIGDWLTDVGYSSLGASVDNSWSACDSGNFIDSIDDLPADCDADDDGVVDPEDCDEIDGWGFIDFECIEPGYFHIDISSPDDTEEIGQTLKFYCSGQADSAEISGPKTLETNPVGSSVSSTTVVVTVWDQSDARIDGAEVTFSTDNCKFAGGTDISPAGGGTTVTTHTDTDSTTGVGNDADFLANNPLEHNAGTAEAVLDCSKGTPGTAKVQAIVQREGSDIVLSQTYTIVGQTALTGLTLNLTPKDLECGETILAVANAVDSVGQPVSDGTVIYFTTDTSSGVIGGVEGAQGQAMTVKGEAQALIATDPGNAGTHTVIAYTVNAAGNVSAQEAATYTCDSAVAPAAPTVNPPATGTGTGSITPPNTGDAGLAAGSSSSSALFVIAGAAFLAIAGMVGFKATRE